MVCISTLIRLTQCIYIYICTYIFTLHILKIITGFITTTITTILTLNLPTTTIVAQPFNVIKWQLKFNPVA